MNVPIEVNLKKKVCLAMRKGKAVVGTLSPNVILFVP